MTRPSEYNFSTSVRVRALVNAGNKCEQCGDDSNVEVHHKLSVYYAEIFYSMIAPWMIASIENALVLCDTCHGEADMNMKNDHTIFAAELFDKFS